VGGGADNMGLGGESQSCSPRLKRKYRSSWYSSGILRIASLTPGSSSITKSSARRPTQRHVMWRVRTRNWKIEITLGRRFKM
jgi:hypothetical protein